MITVSLCMIVKNEEDVLERCLESIASLVDEIIIVDTGSTDRTKEIALKYTQRIYDFVWIDDFAAARNEAFSHASCEYSMWIDADDIITAEDAVKFRKLKENLSPEVAVVMMPYHTGFDENGNVTYSYYRERIVKNYMGMVWIGAVHEVIDTIGERFYADCAVTHDKLHTSDPDRNLRIFETQLEGAIALDPRQQFYYGRELYYHKRYEDALTVLEAFLDDKKGWVENNIDACCHCAYCYYEIDKQDKALQALFRALSFDLPRAEICCDIGRHFFDRQQWQQAAFWYTIATTCKKDESRGGFTALDCYGYLPCIQLCVCYSRLGETQKAVKFNELAGSFKPDSQAVAHNRLYFSQAV